VFCVEWGAFRPPPLTVFFRLGAAMCTYCWLAALTA